jgi:site-specific DNA recombinase
VVLYARISLDKAGTQLGVQRQIADLRALAAERGEAVIGEFVDDNQSIFRRPTLPPQYQQMMALVETGAVAAIYVWHPDRLYRSLRDLEDLVDLVEQFDLQICTVRAGVIDLNTASGRLVARLLGSAARYELELRAERMARKHADTAARGLPFTGGHRPIGYADDRVTIVPSEAAAIRAGAKALLAGESYAFANQLYEQILGHRVQLNQLREVLENPRVAGLRQYIPVTDRRRGIKRGGRLTPAVWPGILDYATWVRVREILADPHRRQPGHARHFVLSGLMLCERCGVGLVGAGRAYKCASKVGGCASLCVSKTGAERVVVDWCRSPEQQRQLREAATYEDPDPDEAEVAVRDERRRELALLYADGRITADEWTTARRELDRRDGPTLVAHRERRRLSTLAKTALETFDNWESATDADQRLAIRIVLGQRQVFVAKVANSGCRFDPSRISILDEDSPRPVPEFIRFRPRGPGCPTKITLDNLERALAMLADGQSKSAICRTLAVSRRNLYKHLARHPQRTRQAEQLGADARHQRQLQRTNPRRTNA